MAGQIIKRGDKRWLVRIFQGRDENGKRRYVNKTIRGTKKNAETYLTAKLRDKDLGINIEPAAESLNTYLDKWLDTAAKPDCEPGHSTTTRACSSGTCVIL
jgi:integrase